MKRTLAILVCAVALVATACGASGDEEVTENEGETATTVASGDDASFGDLPSPCGDGDASVAEGEGPATDKLLLGVANDRSADIRPGLNKEFWDTAQAYEKWCNDQGGIQGLPIELVDLDGQVTNVEAAMTKACTEVFAMVGRRLRPGSAGVLRQERLGLPRVRPDRHPGLRRVDREEPVQRQDRAVAEPREQAVDAVGDRLQGAVPRGVRDDGRRLRGAAVDADGEGAVRSGCRHRGHHAGQPHLVPHHRSR